MFYCQWHISPTDLYLQRSADFADNVVVSDVLQANQTFVPGSIVVATSPGGVNNGKGLTEEASDNMIKMVVNEDFSSGLKHGPLLDHFQDPGRRQQRDLEQSLYVLAAGRRDDASKPAVVRYVDRAQDLRAGASAVDAPARRVKALADPRKVRPRVDSELHFGQVVVHIASLSEVA